MGSWWISPRSWCRWMRGLKWCSLHCSSVDRVKNWQLHLMPFILIPTGRLVWMSDVRPAGSPTVCYSEEPSASMLSTLDMDNLSGGYGTILVLSCSNELTFGMLTV